MDITRLFSERTNAIDASGVRRVFDLAKQLEDPINLSIGQPDFPPPQPIKDAAKHAIDGDDNGYTVTQGVRPLADRIARHLAEDLGWPADGSVGVSVTSGTSGALLLAMLVLLSPGDEVVIPDPYFVMYPHAATMAGGRAVRCPTYPDFRLTAERVEPLITDRTKAVMLTSPSNPCGVVATESDCEELLDLCRRKGVLLISDEIYDEFTYEEARTQASPALGDRCPSPARFEGAHEDVLLVRGFGKTYGVTGWRLGYAGGPKALIEEMNKLQQYTFVCAPAPLQWGVLPSFEVDMDAHVSEYRQRRDMVCERLGAVTELARPSGAFYAFPKVPERFGTAGAFVERCLEKKVLVIPGRVFSDRDTHFRLSYATSRDNLERGLDALVELMS